MATFLRWLRIASISRHHKFITHKRRTSKSNRIEMECLWENWDFGGCALASPIGGLPGAGPSSTSNPGVGHSLPIPNLACSLARSRMQDDNFPGLLLPSIVTCFAKRVILAAILCDALCGVRRWILMWGLTQAFGRLNASPVALELLVGKCGWN